MAELTEALAEQEERQEPLCEDGQSVLFSSRSEDHGTTWSAVTIPGSLASDKPSLAIDTRAGSPYRGQVYVGWFDVRNRRVAFSRSCYRTTATGRGTRTAYAEPAW